MADSSSGALVPSVAKTEGNPPAEIAAEVTAAGAALSSEEICDRDHLCPICMGVIKDAFLSACGHSFCYMCIVTHLNNKNDCPCCGNYLTSSQLYPNFLLNKVRMLNYF